MEKYVKHYMEMAFDKLEFDEFFFEEDEIDVRDDDYIDKYFFDFDTMKKIIESKYGSKRYVVKYPTMITSGRPLAKIRFYDISYMVDDGLVYESEKHNYSNWICFGKRISAPENLLEEDDTCWCSDEHSNFVMKEGDVTYEEYVKKYLKKEKVKKLK